MKLTETNFRDVLPVDGYGPGFFRIGGDRHDGGLLLHGKHRAQWGGFDDLSPLTDLAEHIDVLLLGMGAQMAHPPAELRSALETAGIGVEPMPTPSACRSYNVLLGEGRRIALAAIPI